MNDLPPKIADTLCQAGLVSYKSILETQQCDLRNCLCISDSEIKKLYAIAAKNAKLAEFISGDQLNAVVNIKWSNLSTGCPQLDHCLRGGVLVRGITELSGQSGCGKTQLCLQLAITVQLPLSCGGLNAGAVYICTEDRFPSVRLNQLLNSFPTVHKFPDIQFGNNIFIEHIADVAELQKCVEERLLKCIKQHNIGLIVVDSVAAVFRAEYTSSETLQRARDLRAFASQLHFLANTENIAVVCVNQVSDVKKGERSMTVPALGLAWANLVTCRLQMFRDMDIRYLKVIFAPHLPQQSCQYTITAAGVIGK